MAWHEMPGRSNRTLRYHARMALHPSRICAFAVALALTIAVLGCKDAPRQVALPQGTAVLALGDSLTYGTGATPETSYPALLATITGWAIVNAGVPGETAAQGCERLPSLIEAHSPRLVLVLLGGNDFLRRMPDRGVLDALDDCVAAARAAHADVALIPVPRFGAGGIANASLYDEAGRRLDVPVLEAGLASLLADRAMRSDAVHLNAAGYRAMATQMAKALREHGWLAP